eukprot:scaffold22678_cov65-Phaeocystis_antarctica.AAC.4
MRAPISDRFECAHVPQTGTEGHEMQVAKAVQATEGFQTRTADQITIDPQTKRLDERALAHQSPQASICQAVVAFVGTSVHNASHRPAPCNHGTTP